MDCRKTRVVFCVAVLLSALAAGRPAQAQRLVGVISAGGGVTDSGGAKLVGTIGEAVVGSTQSENGILSSGFLRAAEEMDVAATLRLPTVKGKKGTTVSVPVMLQTTTPVAGAQLSITFNTSVASFAGVKSGSLIANDKDWSVNASLVGGNKIIVVVTAATSGSAPKTVVSPTERDLVQISFKMSSSAKNGTCSPLSFVDITKLAAANGDLIKTALMAGQLCIGTTGGRSLTLSNPKIDPTRLTKDGGIVNFTVEANDSDNVQSVWAEVTMPDNTKQTVTLSLQSDNTFTGTFSAPANSTKAAQVYKIVFYAEDTEGNQIKPTEVAELTIASAQDAPPVISNPIINPTNLSSKGGKVNISATITDDKGVTSAWALINGAAQVELNPKRKSNSYTAAWKAPKNTTTTAQTYTITLYARDTAGNETGPAAAGTVTVKGKSGKRQDALDDGEDAPKIGARSPLTIRLLSTTGGNNGAATVFPFTLNKSAQVTARVLSPTGKAVRQLGARQATAGLNSLMWDGKAQTGGSVARGVYFIEVVAQDEKGQVARAAKVMAVR